MSRLEPHAHDETHVCVLLNVVRCAHCTNVYMCFTHTGTTHGRNIGVQPGPSSDLSENSPEPGTPFTPVQCLEVHEGLLGKCLLGIGQDHDEQGATLMLPHAQRHAESQVALRGGPRNANDDNSRICIATYPDSIFLYFCIG